MNTFIEYIENSCAKLPDNHMAYLYKKKILDEMTERANEMTHSGLKDEKVIADLLMDEYPDLKEGFPAFEKAEKKRSRAKLMRIIMGIGGLIFFIAIFVTYFAVSNATDAWGKSWLIIVGGIFAMIIFYTSFGIKRICRMRRVFHPIARFLLAACVMLFAVFMFLFWLIMIPELTFWPIIMGGIILVLVADTIFAYATKQKFRMVTAMIFMPIITTMVYIILGAYNIVTWNGGWPIAILGFVTDLVYIICIAVSNAKYFMYKREDDE